MRIQTYEEILRNKLECRDRYEQVDSILRESLDTLHSQGIIHGSFLFGSASFGDTKTGSDRDLLVAYNGPAHLHEPAALLPLHEMAKDSYRKTGVHLEITCGTLQQFQAGEHLFPQPILEWLKAQAKQRPDDVIGDNFIDTIAERRRPPHTDFTDLETWIMQTHNNLQKAYLEGYYQNPTATLSAIYGLPHVASRRFLDTLERNGFIATGTVSNLTKQGIREALHATYVGAVAVDLYDDITHHTTLFREEFLPQAASLTRYEYDQVVEAEIEENLPKAIHLLTRLQLAQRAARAHLRLRVGALEQGKTVFNLGDEDSNNAPYLPSYLIPHLREQH